MVRSARHSDRAFVRITQVIKQHPSTLPQYWSVYVCAHRSKKGIAVKAAALKTPHHHLRRPPLQWSSDTLPSCSSCATFCAGGKWRCLCGRAQRRYPPGVWCKGARDRGCHIQSNPQADCCAEERPMVPSVNYKKKTVLFYSLYIFTSSTSPARFSILFY